MTSPSEVRPPSPSRGDSPRVALVLPSVMASGTERRLSFVYRHLVRRYPDEYRLVVSADLYTVLNRGGFGLDRLPGVHVLGRRSVLDLKRGAHAPALVNLGRLFTLFGYRQELVRWAARERITLLHPYLELVPFLAMLPIRHLPWIAAVVDHLPKYFDGRSLDSRLLLRAIRLSGRADCLYRKLASDLAALGVPAEALFNPAWNTANHDAFHPEPKDLRAVSFTARAIDWKNPLLMIGVMDHVLRRAPDVRFAILGTGKMESELAVQARGRPWAGQVRLGYMEDPSPVVNRSLVHVSLDRYDNFSNQTLLEGMAAGCATVASDVGQTQRVVTPDVGVRVPLEAEAIAEAILRLLESPERAQALGRAGRARVLANHHVDRYIDYLRALHDLEQPGPVVDGVRASSSPAA